MMRLYPDLAMRPPPHDDACRDHRQHKIDDGHEPQPSPLMCHLPGSRAELIDADEAGDGEVGREHIAYGADRIADCLAWPGEPGQEELRQAGGEEDEHRGLGAPEPRPDRLPHEAG